jgi:hypothetical protein
MGGLKMRDAQGEDGCRRNRKVAPGDAVWSEGERSLGPLLRKLLPSMTTISAWGSSRSSMAEVKVLSWLNIVGHAFNARVR